tara:strand:- start:5295 stop:7013 length:1719 start_codon:yes stop_codon:yes gene_type:complete
MSNQTTHFGIMGGLFNRKISGRSSMNRVTSRLEIPASAKEGYQYMKMHNLLSKNPLGSGGVGRMFTVRPRGTGLRSIKNTNTNNISIIGKEQYYTITMTINNQEHNIIQKQFFSQYSIDISYNGDSSTPLGKINLKDTKVTSVSFEILDNSNQTVNHDKVTISKTDNDYKVLYNSEPVCTFTIDSNSNGSTIQNFTWHYSKNNLSFWGKDPEQAGLCPAESLTPSCATGYPVNITGCSKYTPNTYKLRINDNIITLQQPDCAYGRQCFLCRDDGKIFNQYIEADGSFSFVNVPRQIYLKLDCDCSSNSTNFIADTSVKKLHVVSNNIAPVFSIGTFTGVDISSVTPVAKKDPNCAKCTGGAECWYPQSEQCYGPYVPYNTEEACASTTQGAGVWCGGPPDNPPELLALFDISYIETSVKDTTCKEGCTQSTPCKGNNPYDNCVAVQDGVCPAGTTNQCLTDQILITKSSHSVPEETDYVSSVNNYATYVVTKNDNTICSWTMALEPNINCSISQNNDKCMPNKTIEKNIIISNFVYSGDSEGKIIIKRKMNNQYYQDTANTVTLTVGPTHQK